MHRDLQSIAIFVAVAEQGSFSKAAKRLGLTNSVISHHVSKLEEKLGITLLYRSTRKVALTDQGRTLYEAAFHSLGTVEDAVTALTAEGDDPVGALQIAMPAFIPDPTVERLIWEFASRYRGIALNVKYSDELQDLIDGGFDIAFRVGSLEDSGMKSKKLADIFLTLVAAPGLLADRNEITDPEDLVPRDFVSLQQFHDVITLVKSQETRRIAIENSRVRVDNIYAARDAALAGLGMMALPQGLCEKELARGAFTRILPDWQLAPLPLHVVWNNHARRNSLTRRLLSFLEQQI